MPPVFGSQEFNQMLALSNMKNASGAAFVSAYDKVQRTRRKKNKQARAKWFGPPPAIWAGEDVFHAVKMGAAPPSIVKTMEKAGMGDAIANAAVSLGEKYLRAVPGVSEVMGALDIAKNIPVIGNLVGEIGGAVEDVIGDVAGNILGEVGGAVMDVVDEIPVVGDVVGAVGSFLGDLF